MDASLTFESNKISAEDLHHITRDVCNTLNRETEVHASLPETPGKPGDRGFSIPPATIVFAVELLTHSFAIVIGESLLMILRTHFERNPSMKAKLRTKSGDEVVLDSESLQPGRIEETGKHVAKILSEP